MIGSCFHGTCNRRRAFTLLEVLLTMCLLVLMASLSWTAMDKPFANVRLRKAADRIRAELYTARVEALESGEIHMFQCTVNEDGYSIECYSTASVQGNALDDSLGGASQPLGGTSQLGGGGAAATKPIEGSLPQDVTFVSCETELDSRAAMIGSELEQSGMAEAGSSAPILFYPDGTTSTARLVLKNEHDRYIELVLRGLTGVVNIGEVSSSEESTP